MSRSSSAACPALYTSLPAPGGRRATVAFVHPVLPIRPKSVSRLPGQGPIILQVVEEGGEEAFFHDGPSCSVHKLAQFTVP